MLIFDLYCSSVLKFLVPAAGTQPRESSALCFPGGSCPSLTLLHPTKLFKEPSPELRNAQHPASAPISDSTAISKPKGKEKEHIFRVEVKTLEKPSGARYALLHPRLGYPHFQAPLQPAAQEVPGSLKIHCMYLGTVLTLVVLPAVV